MAASLSVHRVKGWCLRRMIKKASGLLASKKPTPILSYESSSQELGREMHTAPPLWKSSDPKVCISADKKMIMCWHPEPEFPYEHTQPIPHQETEFAQGDSVLKTQHLLDDKLKNRPDGPTDNELTQIFYTAPDYFKTKHRMEKRLKGRKFYPKDREGL